MSGKLLSPAEDQLVRLWERGSDVGISSRTLVRHLAGLPMPTARDHPHDASDLARCIRALRLLPFLLGEQQTITAERLVPLGFVWQSIAAHWERLIELHDDDVDLGNFSRTATALRAIIAGARDNHRTISSSDLEEALPQLAPAKNDPRTAVYVLTRNDLAPMVGKNIAFGTKYLAALQAEYGTPCKDCGRPRLVVMDSVQPPAGDPLRCNECGLAAQRGAA